MKKSLLTATKHNRPLKLNMLVFKVLSSNSFKPLEFQTSLSMLVLFLTQLLALKPRLQPRTLSFLTRKLSLTRPRLVKAVGIQKELSKLVELATGIGPSQAVLSLSRQIPSKPRALALLRNLDKLKARFSKDCTQNVILPMPISTIL